MGCTVAASILADMSRPAAPAELPTRRLILVTILCIIWSEHIIHLSYGDSRYLRGVSE